MRNAKLSWTFFALGIIGMGVLTLIYGNSSRVMGAMPHWIAGRGDWIYACGAVMVSSGMGLLFSRTARLASGILLTYLLLWLFLLKLPILVRAPSVMVTWETFAITAGLVAGAWVVFASLDGQGRLPWSRTISGENGVRMARILFGFLLFIYGLAHFAYLKYSAALIPAWLPWHSGWVCLTGAGYMAASVGIVLRICPRLAAAAVTVMMTAITFLTWIPQLVDKPIVQFNWTEFFTSWALTASAWVIADTYRGAAWLSIAKPWRVKSDPETGIAS